MHRGSRSHFANAADSAPYRPLIVAIVIVMTAMAMWAAESRAGEAGPTVAFYNPVSAKWRMDGVGEFYYGIGGDTPMLCDWDGDGIDTVGQYRQRSGFLYLRNSNTLGYADLDIFYGIREDLPVCGDWDGDGDDTIGVFRPSEARFYLRNSTSTTTRSR